MKNVKIETKTTSSKYDVRISSGSLLEVGEWTSKTLGRKTGKIAVVSNKKVFSHYGEEVVDELAKIGFTVSVFIIGDGERYKNLASLNRILEFLNSTNITRSNAIVALGGGVIGDLAGFAASVHLRGVKYLQIPTTLVSMLDSSVGGKTGINTRYGKNLVGTFHQPSGVLIDPITLVTLPPREFAAGLLEAIKQGAVSGKTLFRQTENVIETLRASTVSDRLSDSEFSATFEDFLAAHVSFKAKIVMADERESTVNSSPHSRKILNFGHTFAHAIERTTNYRTLKHGEAVGYGIIFAAELSKKLGLLDGKVVNLLRGVVHRVGVLPSIRNVDPKVVFESFRFDKKHTGASLNWVLLADIGKPLIVPHDKVGDKFVKRTIREIIEH